jgi:hypothetical protein
LLKIGCDAVGQTNLSARHIEEALHYARAANELGITNQDTLMDFVAGADRAATNTVAPGLDSTVAFTHLLEQRWPLESIRAFCIPERRDNAMYQRPVLDPPFLDGTLYEGRKTDFDKIAWRAGTTNGRVSEFDLTAQSGRNFWVLEGGSVERLKVPPSVTPDPHEPWFMGHK